MWLHTILGCINVRFCKMEEFHTGQISSQSMHRIFEKFETNSNEVKKGNGNDKRTRN